MSFSPPTTYQPFLLVTSDYDVAKKFFYPDKNISTVLESIDLSNPRILLAPHKNNQYFNSFDYNVSYEKKDQFIINLEFIDVNYDFELFFIKFIFSQEKYKDKINELVSETLNNEQGVLPTVSFTFDRKYFQTELLQIGEAFSDVSQNIYFVFGINNRSSGTLVSQFLTCEVTQAMDGFKKLKLKFATVGNPSLLSDLNKITYPLTSLKTAFENNEYKVYDAFIYEKQINLLEYSRSGKLDHLIKYILKKLFIRITGGKDVIILLPDFNVLYKNFINSNSLSSKLRSLRLANNIYNSVATQISFSKDYIEFLTVVEFLNVLGFSVETNVFSKLQEYKDNTSTDDANTIRAGLQNLFREVNAILEKYNVKEEVKTRFLNSQPTLDDYGILANKVDENEKTIYQNYLKKRLEFEQHLTDLLKKKQIEVQDILPTWLKPKLKSEFSSSQLSFIELLFLEDASYNLGVPIYKRSSEINLEGDTQQVIKALESTKQTLTEFLNGTKIQFQIIKRLDGESSYSVDSVYPEVKQYINFDAFISDFGRRLSNLGKGTPFRVGFYEENDLPRLEFFNKHTTDYATQAIETGSSSPVSGIGESNPYPLVSNYKAPAIVIGEQLLIRNLFTPLTTTKIDFPSYPVSQADLDNFGVNSKYFKFLTDSRNKTINYINSFYNEQVNTDILNYIADNNNSKLSNDKKLPIAFPVFLFNYKNANVLTYSLDVDTQLQATAYRELVSYLKFQIIKSALAPVRNSYYINLLNLDQVKKKVKDFIADQYVSQSDLINRIATAIKGELPPYDPANPPDPSAPTDRNKLSNFNVSYGKETEEEIDLLVKSLFEDLFFQIMIDYKGEVRFESGSEVALDPLLIKIQHLRSLYTKLYRVNIKTFPFFDICNGEKLSSGAILLIKNIINPLTRFGDEYNFLSGLYLINGFRHVISLTGAYSEFSLTKYPDIGGIE